jgi:Cu(I)/Ag(I) efflux system periplasmic protein CusF
MMKKTIVVLALALAMMLNAVMAGPAWAQSALTDGLVTKVDASAGKITIKHGPMKKFDMEDGMTMVYRVQDPAMLTTVKAGDKVKFDAEHVNGQFTVTKIQKIE